MAVFWLSPFNKRKGYLLEQLYHVIQAILYWLEGYLVLFTIASIKPLFPELYNPHNKETVHENNRYRIK